jgi:putative ABC transport system permease protein
VSAPSGRTHALSPRLLVRSARRSLAAHALRSALSVIGVVCGVAAVVTMSSVGEGARRQALAELGALGIDSITVKARAGGEALRLRDAEAVQAVVPRLLAVAPVRALNVDADAGGRIAPAEVVGTLPSYAVAGRLRVAEGRFLAALDEQDRKRVAVLGATLASRLFPFGAALGERVRLGSDWFTVVGVLEDRASPRGRSGPIRSRDVNACAFVPLGALATGGTADGVDELVLRVDGAEQVRAAAEATRAVLRRTAQSDGYELVVPREILRQKERTQRVFNVVTGAVAAISLLVGGIGIMNIMLASVAERRHEVGIRRAVGASRRDIAAQFLTESALLTAIGGALGLVGGLVGSSAVQHLAGWPTALAPGATVLALVTAVAVGIGFGAYPAWRAAHLEPMAALRS